MGKCLRRFTECASSESFINQYTLELKVNMKTPKLRRSVEPFRPHSARMQGGLVRRDIIRQCFGPNVALCIGYVDHVLRACTGQHNQSKGQQENQHHHHNQGRHGDYKHQQPVDHAHPREPRARAAQPTLAVLLLPLTGHGYYRCHRDHNDACACVCSGEGVFLMDLSSFVRGFLAKSKWLASF